jgi:hypothetical protein
MLIFELLPSFLTPPEAQLGSPIGSLWTSFVLVLTVTVAGVLIVFILGSWMRDIYSPIIESLKAIDDFVVKTFSWVVGTHWFDQRLRVVVVLAFFFGFALGGTFLRWPYCLAILAFGLFGVFVVFRHWSHNEDAVEYQLRPEDKDVSIDGNLNIELIIACAFVFVLAPIGFAQMHKHDGSFFIASESEPYAFVRYMLVESTKVVPYHELFTFLPKGEANPPLEVKSAIFVFQTTLFVIVVTALKRFFDIAQRVALGLDLRPAIQELQSDDVSDNLSGVERLRRSAIRGRPGAKDILIDILNRRSDEQENTKTQALDDDDGFDERTHLRYPPEVRFEAANALRELGERLGKQKGSKRWLEEDPEENKARAKVTLQHAVDGYETIQRYDWTREKDDRKWAEVQAALGDAYLAVGKLETFQDRIKKAKLSYKKALRYFGALSPYAAVTAGLKDKLVRLRDRYNESDRILDERRHGVQNSIRRAAQTAGESLASLTNSGTEANFLKRVFSSPRWLSKLLFFGRRRQLRNA